MLPVRPAAALALSLLVAGCRDRARRGAGPGDGPAPAGARAGSWPPGSAPGTGSAAAPLWSAPVEAALAVRPPSPLDAIVDAALARGEAAGAVVLVQINGEVVLRRAYGERIAGPAAAAMTEDTVFDLASLTKPVVTATLVMRLVEQGRIGLRDEAAKYLPELAGSDKRGITIEQLLLHTAGLEADDPVSDYAGGMSGALRRIAGRKLVSTPGAAQLYSDVGYVLLGEIASRVGGRPLDALAEEQIFSPLGLHDTGFRPPAALAARAAPTELREGRMLQGEVHDPRAHALGGVAGHAGLFSTADDLAVFARMLLDGGQRRGRQVLGPAAVKALLEPRAAGAGVRALGWDGAGSGSARSHTGFTGTLLWFDPATETILVALTSRLHPEGRGNVRRLRRELTAAVASGILAAKPMPPESAQPGVLVGLDVMARGGFAELTGRRVGLITNPTGVDRQGVSSIDRLREAPGVTLVALFSPEHGLRADEDRAVGDGRDERSGLPVFSLYGARRRPSAAQLAGLDTLVFDLQDAGCRFYTYETTLGYALEAAAAAKISLVVLDRPNPLGGLRIEGPLVDEGRESFTGYHALPVRHGLTVGELARLYNAERSIGADLTVVPMEGWRRGDYFDATGLRWVRPSPNLKSPASALLYPGVGLLELTNVSVGRGTARPFEWVGAPFIDGERLASALSAAGLEGASFEALSLVPGSSAYAGVACGGVAIGVLDRERLTPVALGYEIARQLARLYPGEWRGGAFRTLLANEASFRALGRGETREEVLSLWRPGEAAFRERRRPFLIYPSPP